MLSLAETKAYLRVDTSDEDKLIESLIEQSEDIVKDVARAETIDDIEDIPVVKTAGLYTVAYLFEHREESNMHALMLTLRSLLFGVRRVIV